MDPKEKQHILSEGQKHGITRTCEKYGISRTLYYRWLRRYEREGMEGLSSKRKSAPPRNRTPKELEERLLTLIRTYPTLGPREQKYLLEELNIHLSESAVYNIMKRYGLSRREQRLIFSRRKPKTSSSESHPLEEAGSGECWFFFITSCGNWQEGRPLYIYSIMDFKSRIACSRLYEKLSLDAFEDLLSAAALPVAQSLGFQAKHLCYLEEANLPYRNRQAFEEKILSLIHVSGFDPEFHFFKADSLPQEIRSFRENYTKICLSSLLPPMARREPLTTLKIILQREIRTYNLSFQSSYEEEQYSPLEYHKKSVGEETILPLWAYMDRDY